MRKHLIFAALAAFGALIISSCEREKDITTPTPKDNEVSLVLAGVATRSAEMNAPVINNTYALGEVEEGLKLFLEETVTEMGDLVDDAAETRGTPVYKENVTDVLGNTFNGEVWGASSRVAADGPFNALAISGGRYTWRRELGFDLWDKAGGPVPFYLHMPSTPAGVSNLAVDNANKSIAFDYTTPETATEQQDILFASRTIDKDTYIQEYKNGGASVLFRHALTGVKFAIGNNTTQTGNRTPNGEVQTFITKVEITGLLNAGHAVFVPTGTETTVDDKAEYSSAGSFTWTDGSMSPTRETVYVQTYGDDDIQDFQSGDAVNAAESFYNGGANRNLNKADASLTFWFRPQEITNDLQVKVTLKIWSGDSATGVDNNGWSKDKELVLNLGQIIKEQQTSTTNKEWKAGQLRTFTLKPNAVDVDIDDEVHGFIKNNVVIKNTGNVDAYIRAYIVANWWGTNDAGDDGLALGYPGNETAPYQPMTFITPWELDYPTRTDNYFGTFTGLPGSGWKKATDGFYYNVDPVAPGDATSTPLFVQYELKTSEHPAPYIYYLSNTGGYKLFGNIRLVMDIPVQAIEAKDTYRSFEDAWKAATGETLTFVTD